MQMQRSLQLTARSIRAQDSGKTQRRNGRGLCRSLLFAFSVVAGCGATKSYVATEQLLLSDAIDATVDQIDFTALAGRRVFLDTTYVMPIRSTAGQGLVNTEYIVSSVREQMLLAGCYLSPDKEKAEVIAELRVGAMGTDGHTMTVGVPATNQMSSVQVGGNSLVPALPELSFAKRDTMSGGAKVAVFAYLRETREAVWQSGVAQATSDASDTWVMGVGPRQQGSIHEHAESKPVRRPNPPSSVVADQAKHRTRPLISNMPQSGHEPASVKR
jgi:hypothetical protein